MVARGHTMGDYPSVYECLLTIVLFCEDKQNFTHNKKRPLGINPNFIQEQIEGHCFSLDLQCVVLLE